MTFLLPPILQKQQETTWQQFYDQHGHCEHALTKEQLSTFKHAITLSDFILKSALQAPELVIDAVKLANAEFTPNYASLLNSELISCENETKLHRILRRFRLQYMVIIAIDDLIFNASLDSSLERLSLLADSIILASLTWLTHTCEAKWGIPSNKQGERQMLLVYGMGKLGGKELNFSSDIDLIFTYPEGGETQGSRRSIDNQQFFIRLAQKLITSLHQVTCDGFVYRVDMRLRPFGESGPLVMSFNAMEDYYQEHGRDWERYAMLKARVLGNFSQSNKLSTRLRPFVYRRYIDFSVIDSLRRMKMMIAQEVRRKQLINNIKLGAGGIREIEFIVQVFQLVRGGRIQALRQRTLLTVLPKLVKSNELSTTSAKTLEDAYRFLRRVENIIQALHDQQSHTLPESALDQARILSVLAISDWTDFLALLSQHMDNVHDEFNQLIGEESPPQSFTDEHWITLWHSHWSDEESIKWLQKSDNNWKSDVVWSVLLNFRKDIAKRSIGNRGRQVLDKLIPLLLSKLKTKQHADEVLIRVLQVFRKIVSRTAYLELLYENHGALSQLIHLCHASRWVTDYIAAYPILLDELIDPQLLHNVPDINAYALELRERMLRVPEDNLEEQMQALRQFKQSQQLRIAAAEIAEILPLTKISDHLTALAEAILTEIINLAWQQVRERFGVPTSCIDKDDEKGFGVIAYGKAGGYELGYSSDLDLVFVHQSDISEVTTGKPDGSRVIPAGQFYAKLTQRIMHIFNTRMNNGVLYELDMRLRPSGNSGLLVIHLNAFEEYQQQEAWTWEHQALVRARMIFGSEPLITQFNSIRQRVISKARNKDDLQRDITHMREKMRDHLDKSTDGNLEIKQGHGGLVDIEFLAQFLVLCHSSKYSKLAEVFDNLTIFKRLAELRLIKQSEQEKLSDRYIKLRACLHQAALQNSEGLIKKNSQLGKGSEVVTDIWAKYLESKPPH